MTKREYIKGKEESMKIVAGTLAFIILLAGFMLAEEIEVSGEIAAIEEVFSEEEGNINILKLQLRTRTREMVEAHLGPAWYLEDELEVGDEIDCIGRYEEDSKFHVRVMVRNTVRREIRGEDYDPLWLRTRLEERSQFYNPLREKHMKGSIQDLYMYEDDALMEAKLRLQNEEEVRVRFSPEWFLQNQLRMGDELEIRGSEVKCDGQVMILARVMRNQRTHLEIALRNRMGFPIWREKRHTKPDPKEKKAGRARK
jgi:hypothetical protein